VSLRGALGNALGRGQPGEVLDQRARHDVAGYCAWLKIGRGVGLLEVAPALVRALGARVDEDQLRREGGSSSGDFPPRDAEDLAARDDRGAR
jgi:hypothetical protein